MFVNNAHFLVSEIHCRKSGSVFAYSSTFFPLVTKPTRNGCLLVKDTHGHTLGQIKNFGANCHSLFLGSRQVVDGSMTEFRTRIQDEVLSKRIIDYMKKFYGEYRTNCSSLAEYLTTGHFEECDITRDSFMFSKGLTGYSGQKIKPGDVLCILYYRKAIKSRKAPAMRKHYISCVKNSEKKLETLTQQKQKTFSPKEVLEIYQSGCYADYHFMICVGVFNGQPVFLQQAGRHRPHEDDITDVPIIISIGMKSFSHHDVPAFMFIKRGRAS